MNFHKKQQFVALLASGFFSATVTSAAPTSIPLGSANIQYPANVVLSPSPEAIRKYDAKGRVAIKWQNGVQTQNFYRNGKRVVAIRSDGVTAKYVYYKNGLLKQVTWSDGTVQSVIYNKNTGKVIGVYSNLGARLTVKHDAEGKVSYVATVKNQPVANTLVARAISGMANHRPKTAKKIPGSIRASEMEFDDGDGYDGGYVGGGWVEAFDNGSGGYEDAPAVDDPPASTPIVNVTGVSCSTDPSQDACQDPPAGDAADASGDLPSGEPPSSSPPPGWHGPQGCPPTAIVKQCKDDVYASYEETIQTVCKKMLTARGRQQCYSEQATLLADQLRQCESTLLCRDE